MEFIDKNTAKPDIVFITGGSGFIGSRIIKVFSQLPRADSFDTILWLLQF